MPEKLLSVKDLSIHYVYRQRTVKAVNAVSFWIDRGSVVGLVGETGAGKTTTALGIMRLLPSTTGKIRGGQIIFNRQNLVTASEAEMRQIRGAKISMVFQDPMTSLNPVERVGDQIGEVIRLHDNLDKALVRSKAGQIFHMVGISDERLDDYPHQFSGGMKQRVVIAMALACNPELIIADEPTTALDVTIQAQILNLISDLKNKQGTSMLLITHDMGIVAQMCDYVVVLYAGEVVEYGDIRQVIKNPRHPYTIGLLDSLPKLTEDVSRLHTIDGVMPDPADLPAGCVFAERCRESKQICFEKPAPIIEVEPGHLTKCHLV